MSAGPGPRPSQRRLAASMLLAAVAASVAAAVGTGMRASRWAATTGDEPHYLLTAISLAEDGDLDVADEHAADRYRPFHEAPLTPQARARDDGTMVVPHDPLLPALLAPAMAAGGHVAAKLMLGLVAGALAALTVWAAVRRLGTSPRSALVVVVVLAASAPLAPYGSQIYPELPAALAVACAAAAVTGPLGRGGLAVALASLVALPWLSVKYVPVAAVLAAVGGVRLVRAGRRSTAAGCAAALAAAGLAYAAAHLAWYGGVTVYAAGTFFANHGGEQVVIGTDPAWLGRSRRLLGLLVDRDFGIAAWQPAWLAAVPALVALARRRPGWAPVVVAPAAAAWLTATFVAATMHGWWFPGRQVIVTMPLLALAIAWWVDCSPRRLAAVTGLGAVGVASWVWLVVEGWLGRITLVVSFAGTSNPWYRLWRALRPDGSTYGAELILADLAWTAVLAGAAVLAWRWASWQPGAAPTLPADRHLSARLR